MAKGEADLEGWQRELIHTVLDGFYEWCGIELISLGEGRSDLRLRARPELLTPWGGVNGATLSGLLELPSFLALLSDLEEGEFPVTNDLFVQHLRGVPGDAEVRLEGRLLRRGRSMAWTEASASVDGRVTTLARITKTLQRS